jgi:hypothetical protein
MHIDAHFHVHDGDYWWPRHGGRWYSPSYLQPECSLSSQLFAIESDRDICILHSFGVVYRVRGFVTLSTHLR